MLFKNVKENIKKKLEKLAEENRKIYGGQKPDCCTAITQKKQVIKNK